MTDEYVFYIGYDSDRYNNVIHRMDKDGGNDIVLTQDDCSDINIAGSRIYYISRSFDHDFIK